MSKQVMYYLLGLLAVVVVGIIITVATLFSMRGTAISLEEKVKSQHVSNKSNYDNMWKSFKESAQVTEKQANEFKDVYDDMISGRYKNDKETIVKMVQEQNPNLNADVYVKLQDLIESGRSEFDNNQKKISDIIREYNTYIRKHFIMNAIFHFETLDANDYVVTSEKTEGAFKTGKDDEIDLSK